MKSNTSRTLIVIGVVILTVVCIGGWIASSVFINVQKQSCHLLEAGIQQIAPTNSGQPAPQTAVQCLKAIEMATPFFRFWGWVFVGILVVGGLMTLYAIMMIFGRKTAKQAR